MKLPIFYDRMRAAAGAMPEPLMREQLTEALEIVSRECGVPRVRVVATLPTGLAEGVVALPMRARHVLTPTVGAGRYCRLTTGQTTGDDDEVVYQLSFVGAASSFEVDVECYPPAVPSSDDDAAFEAFEVPFEDVPLNYILSELYAKNGQPEMARLYYSRYEQGKLSLKRDARKGADTAESLVPYPAPYPHLEGTPVRVFRDDDFDGEIEFGPGA